MNTNNVLGVPSEDQINGIYAEDILLDCYEIIENPDGQEGKVYKCKCCGTIFPGKCKKSRRTKHLERHAMLNSKKKIKYFEKSEVPGKLMCRLCCKEVIFKNSMSHIEACEKKNGRYIQKKLPHVLKAYILCKKEKETLLTKRLFEEKIISCKQEERKMEDPRPQSEEEDLENEDRLRKRVQKEAVASSSNRMEMKNRVHNLVMGSTQLKGKGGREKLSQGEEKEIGEMKIGEVNLKSCIGGGAKIEFDNKQINGSTEGQIVIKVKQT